MKRPSDEMLTILDDLKVIEEYIPDTAKYSAADVYMISILSDIKNSLTKSSYPMVADQSVPLNSAKDGSK
jgi:hypothetical protein